MASSGSGLTGLTERYAAALFDLADEQKVLDGVADDLLGLKTALSDSPDLAALTRSPLLKRSEQERAITSLLSSFGANDLVVKFCGLLAHNRRLFALGAMIDAFLAELARRRGDIVAEVVTAKQLTEAQFQRLEDALKKSLGTGVNIEASVDPSLLGGMIVRAGSRMIDSSLRTKLTRLQLVMKGAQ